jgi:hypothetical protein
MAISKIVFGSLKLYYGKEVNERGTLLCLANIFEFQWLMRVELTMVAILSTLRYLIVCHKIKRSFLFWCIITIIACVPCTFVHFYPAIIGDAKPSKSYLLCYPYSNHGDLKSFILNGVMPFLFAVPSWIITFSYFSIGHRVYKQLNQMKIDAEATNDKQALQAIKKQKLKLIIQLAAVIFIYNLFFSVSYITQVLKFAIGYIRTPSIEALAGILTFLTFALNPLLTITFQPELNLELASLLFFLGLKIKKALHIT